MSLKQTFQQFCSSLVRTGVSLTAALQERSRIVATGVAATLLGAVLTASPAEANGDPFLQAGHHPPLQAGPPMGEMVPWQPAPPMGQPGTPMPLHAAPHFQDSSGSLAIQPQEPGTGGMGANGRIGHEVGGTVGRRESITTFDASPYMFFNNSLLFGDGRLFIANNGRVGGSAGLGLRHFLERFNSVGGVSFYYDHDAHRGVGFDQFGVSGEIFTEWLDIRSNVYIPFGNTEEVLSVAFEPGSQQFVDHNIVFQRRTFIATAMEGFDTTFTAPIPGDIAQRFNLEASAGFYNFQVRNRDVDQAWGWSLRLDADILDRLSHMFLQFTHDKVFKGNLVFGVDINYRHHQDARPRIGQSQYNRMAQWVRRNRHVVALETSFLLPPELAINPVTGQPYLVYHVRNVPGDPPPPPSGDGTVENPFQFIREGIDALPEGDLVFVHGNSIFDGDELVLSDAIVRMRDGLLVMGEGVPLNIPVVNLPERIPLPTATIGRVDRPIIQNVPGPAVTLASGSRFAGFDLINIADAPAILGEGIVGSEVNEVRITTTTGPQAHGISLQPRPEDGDLIQNTGLFRFQNISIEDTGGNAFNVVGGTANIVFEGTNIIENSEGFSVLIQDTLGGAVNLRGTSIVDTGGLGIAVRGTSPGSSRANVTFEAVELIGTNPAFARPGIEIVNHARGVSFLETISIDGNNGDAFVVSNLQPVGSVSVQGSTIINNRNGHGILVQNLVEGPDPLAPEVLRAGSVTFSGDVTMGAPIPLADLPPGEGLDPAIVFQSPTGTLRFSGNVLINGSHSTGVDITDIANVGSTRGQFLSSGFMTINDTADVAFIVDNVAKRNFLVQTNGITINDRLNMGILVSEYAGIGRFLGTNSVNNLAGSTADAVNIINNTGEIGFGTLTANDVLGVAGDLNFGVLVQNNRNPTPLSRVSFTSLNVNTEDAIAVSIIDNDEVTVSGGVLLADGERALEVFDNSRHDMTFNSISAFDSDFGIIVEDSPGRLQVVGTGNFPVAGGSIQNMSEAGARFLNTQVVDLNWMEFSGNQVGVHAEQILQRAFAFTPQVNIRNTEIFDSSGHAILGVNVSTFLLQNSILIDNGRPAPVTPQVELVASVRQIDVTGDGIQDFVQYTYTFDGNEIADGPGAPLGTDMVLIRTAQIGQGAPLDLFFINHTPTDAFPARGITANRSGAAALGVTWTGEVNATVDNNDFFLEAGANQIGTRMFINGPADVVFSNNSLSALGTNATGVNFIFQRAASVEISNNFNVDEDGFLLTGSGFLFSGTGSTGIDLTFNAPDNLVFIENNLIEFGTGATSGTGIIVRRIFAPSTVQIDGNVISLDIPVFIGPGFGIAQQVRGIVFQDVRGVINLNGTVDNIIEPAGPFPLVIDFQIPLGTSTGSILINGGQRP